MKPAQSPEPRANACDSTGGDKGHKRGRKPVPLSEDTLRRALESGAEFGAIAKANGCSLRTVQRRVAAARETHGQLWGKPLKPAKPPPKPPPAPPTPAKDDRSNVVDEAVALVRSTIRGERGDLRDRLAAAKIAFAHADLMTPKPPGQKVAREDLLAKVRLAVERADTKHEDARAAGPLDTAAEPANVSEPAEPASVGADEPDPPRCDANDEPEPPDDGAPCA